MLMYKFTWKYVLVDGHVLANFMITSNNSKIETKHVPFIFSLLTQNILTYILYILLFSVAVLFFPFW